MGLHGMNVATALNCNIHRIKLEFPTNRNNWSIQSKMKQYSPIEPGQRHFSQKAVKHIPRLKTTGSC